MNLAIGPKQVFVVVTLFAKDGSPKLVPACTYPLTGLACVARVYTEHAVFDLGPDGAVLRETFGCSARGSSDDSAEPPWRTWPTPPSRPFKPPESCQLLDGGGGRGSASLPATHRPVVDYPDDPSLVR